jgi:UDP-2,3-diacylglucosamine hydrolase
VRIIFISDLHLSPETKTENDLFVSLMKVWVLKYDAIYILGDFFDYWVGDDDNNDFTSLIKTVLLEFTQYKPIYFIVGNHDFALGRKFAEQTGVQIIKDLTRLTLGKYNVLLSHGDVFCTLDKPYQRMKLVLQNKYVVFLLSKLPLKIRYMIKNKLEKSSQDSYNKATPDKYNVVDNSIIKYCLKYNCNIVIHGHTHNPGLYEMVYNNLIIKRYEIPNWHGKKIGGYVEFIDNDFKINVSN